MKTKKWNRVSKLKRQRTIIDVIPHHLQDYETCGNYKIDKRGTSRFYVSDTGNENMNFLIGLHEQVEAQLTRRKGITDDEITEFDELFEEERRHGFHSQDAEPGNDTRAPYRKEHVIATAIEMMMCSLMDLDWNLYEEAISAL